MGLGTVETATNLRTLELLDGIRCGQLAILQAFGVCDSQHFRRHIVRGVGETVPTTHRAPNVPGNPPSPFVPRPPPGCSHWPFLRSSGHS